MNIIKLIITLIVISSIYDHGFYIDGKQNNAKLQRISEKLPKNSHLKNNEHKINKIKRTKIKNRSHNIELVASSFDSTKDPYHRKIRYSILSLFLPWLYFMSVSINISSYPKLVNFVINKGNTDVTSLSSKVFGNISGIDAFFTCLSVNLIGCLSDRYGRKIFMFVSSFGLGFAYLLASFATLPKHFYISACIDGLTSCMLSQSQAYITDFSNLGSNLSIELSKFQGIAVGCAFMVGIPLGAILSKHSVHAPLYASISLCILNCILIPLLPTYIEPSSSVTKQANQQQLKQQPAISSISTTNSTIKETDYKKILKRKSINWKDANPFGVAVKLTSTRKLFIGSIAYFLLNLAQAGLQCTWINYLQYRFGWSTEQSGSTLMIVGLIVAVLPPIVIPTIGVVNAFKYGLLLHALSLLYLGTVTSSLAVFLGMPFLAAGASGMPILLGYLTEQVPRSEVGALQGAADTVRTISVTIGSPLITRVFSYFISNQRNFPSAALYVSALFSFIGYILVANF